ncbi:MAG: Cof-type HAD-IIB family hydrolase [Blautia sp.]|nr:Cof-type HAD-IIB family hydrolase [Blautia sp.]
MNYKLLVLDIDGTVTNSDKKVLEKTRKAIIGLQEKGVSVAIASGRAPKGVFSIAKELELHRFGNYILSFNGAKIINFQTRECVYEKYLPLHIPGRLWKDALEYQLGILTYTDDVLIAGTQPDPYMALEARISDMPIEFHENFQAGISSPVNGCLLTGDPENIEALEPVFVRKYFHETEIFRSEPCFLEVVPKNVDKAYSLKHLLEILGISREETVCCGDSFNDITMVQYAGLGVAMANAQEKLKHVANYITEHDNDHDGIAEVIEKFF